MKNTIGSSFTVTLFGESHGPAVGAVLDGLAPGIPVREESIKKKLALRRPFGAIGTARREEDDFEILSGVFNGRSTGTPLTVVIRNEDKRSSDYEKSRGIARPGHSDYTAFLKYHGYEDYRGGGHFSGRLTAAIVAAGAIAGDALLGRGIRCRTHIAALEGIKDRPFGDLFEDAEELDNKPFPVLDEQAALLMREAIERAASDGDSVGGVLESALTGVPGGLGEPFFDSFESLLSHALFSIPGIKGVEFGDGFDLVNARGSVFNDAFRIKDGAIVTLTNHNGGINGGITNGMPILFRCAVKPTPSIGIEQETVDFKNGKETAIRVSGRHDPAIIHRVRAVVDAMTAIVTYDLLCGRYGCDYFGG